MCQHGVPARAAQGGAQAEAQAEAPEGSAHARAPPIAAAELMRDLQGILLVVLLVCMAQYLRRLRREKCWGPRLISKAGGGFPVSSSEPGGIAPVTFERFGRKSRF